MEQEWTKRLVELKKRASETLADARAEATAKVQRGVAKAMDEEMTKAQAHVLATQRQTRDAITHGEASQRHAHELQVARDDMAGKLADLQARRAKREADEEALKSAWSDELTELRRSVRRAWHELAVSKGTMKDFLSQVFSVIVPSPQALEAWRRLSEYLGDRLHVEQSRHALSMLQDQLKTVIDALQNPLLVHDETFVAALESKGLSLEDEVKRDGTKLAQHLNSFRIVAASDLTRLSSEQKQAEAQFQGKWGQDFSVAVFSGGGGLRNETASPTSPEPDVEVKVEWIKPKPRPVTNTTARAARPRLRAR